jgi:DNA-directed RNA polymerase specialized sigma24 family protein
VLGLSDEEAGAVLGVKPGVRVRVWRALGRLRRELGEEVKQL